MNYRKLSLLPLLALATVTLTACSFSKSSESSSASSEGIFGLISSPSTSSSDSSATEQEKYENEVTDYTAEFVNSSSGTLESFREHISKVAQDHGITNWESDHTTYVAIGRGLKKANLNDPQISAFTESLSENDPMKKQFIQEGLNK
ncbi:putative lipoprotein [Methylomonas sp. MgM2]